MFDVCIIGGGAAGLMLAHSLPSTYKIAVLTKNTPEIANSYLAQGGIAASLDKTDSPEAHAWDTLLATADHSDPDRVEMLAKDGQTAIKKLMAEGLPYDQDESGQPILGMEGAHSTRRILHSGGDQTGKNLMDYLMKKTEKKIHLLPEHQALELIMDNGKCCGAVASNRNGQRQIIPARYTVLATGGIGALYSHTSNSPVAGGEGLSLAYHAGAVLEDLEFVQFHPTILTIDGKSEGLISEAVRGEGAFLINKDGHSIMDDIHPMKELAPRDIVARTIEWHWQIQGPVFLDARSISGFKSKFPAIWKNLRTHGIDPARDLLPVRPGAHFHMGGVKTDDKGATSISGLYAIGEVASSGVHGANRLASNSLLEAIVFAKRLADDLVEQNSLSDDRPPVQVNESIESATSPLFDFPDMGLMRSKMTDIIGILRDKEQLNAFITDYPLRPIKHLLNMDDEDISNHHQMTVCTLIATAAYLRTESRGAHFRTDFPSRMDEWQGKVIELSKAGSAITYRKTHSKETVK